MNETKRVADGAAESTAGHFTKPEIPLAGILAEHNDAGKAKLGLVNRGLTPGCDYCDKGHVYYYKRTKGKKVIHVGSCALCGTGPQWMTSVNPKLVTLLYCDV